MKKKNIIISIILTVVSVIYTFLVKNVDVKSIGPDNSKVGFATLNDSFRNFIGSNLTIYKITEVLGILILLIVLMYGLLGIYQLIKRKSILKVDKEIIILGIFYVLMLTVYVLFEKVEINYRPILIDGKLEASYPSSHTILALCIGISSFLISKKYIRKEYVTYFNVGTLALMTLIFLGRTISGVHWISDIIGGIIISATLIMYFYTAITYLKKDN